MKYTYSIKEQLCMAVQEIKQEDNLTYNDLRDFGGLSRSQVGCILQNKGDGVSVCKIESLLKNLGWLTEVHLIPSDDDVE